MLYIKKDSSPLKVRKIGNYINNTAIYLLINFLPMPNHESIPKATVHATAITNTSQTGNPSLQIM